MKFTSHERAEIYLRLAKKEFVKGEGVSNYYNNEKLFPELTLINQKLDAEYSEWKNIRVLALLLASEMCKDKTK